MALLQIGSRDDPIHAEQAAAWRQSIATLSSAQTLTVPKKATGAIIYCNTQAVRFTLNGDAPTATEGIPLAVGDVLVLYGSLAQFKVIEQTASAALRVNYFR